MSIEHSQDELYNMMEESDIDIKPEPTFILEGLRRNSNLVIFDGFAYHTNYTTDKVRYLQCASRIPLGCGARACMALESETRAVQLKKPHSHGPDPHLIQRTTFIQELKRRVVQQAGTIKSIYDQTCLDFPNASSLVAFQTIESTLRRVRSTTQPRNPSNIQEYGELISKNEWRRFSQTVNGKPFYSTTLEGDDGSTAIIFSNPDFVEKVSLSTQLHVDASFLMEPSLGDGKYFFSAHVIMHRHSNAIMYALMSHRSSAMFTVLLSYLRQIAPALNPSTIICDYERSLFLALRDVFPNCTIQGSYYHYLQHVYQKVTSFGLLSASETNPEIANLIRMLMALPLLPANKIAIGLNVVDDCARQHLQLLMYNKLMGYLDKEWWYGVTAPLISTYNNPDTTNNNINMFHKTIRQRFRGISNAWLFTEKLKEVECLTFRDFELLQGGHAIGRERKTKLLTSDDRLNRAWRMIETRRLPTVVFLERAAEVVRNIEGQFRFLIDDYEDVELIKGTDVLENPYEVPDRRLFTSQSEGIVYSASKRKKICSKPLRTTAKRPLLDVPQQQQPVDSKICVVCKDDDWEARCQLKPCGHKPLCSVCAARLLTEKNKCPICKRILSGFSEFELS